MSGINNRIFGSDLTARVKAKLTARQNLADKQISPNESVSNNQRAKDIDISSFNSLSVGDRLVHKYHGVAQFKGVFDFGDRSSSDERLLLEFLDGGKIYVSAQNLGLIDFRMKNGGTTLNITLSSGFGTTKAIAEVTRNSSNVVRVLKNGVSLGSGTGSGTFGFEQIGTSSNSLTSATIFEVVIFSSALSSADATKVRNDIADRNSISL